MDRYINLDKFLKEVEVIPEGSAGLVLIDDIENAPIANVVEIRTKAELIAVEIARKCPGAVLDNLCNTFQCHECPMNKGAGKCIVNDYNKAIKILKEKIN